MAATRLNQLGGGVARVGDGEDFVGSRGFALDEVGDAARENGCLAGAGAGDDQHGAVNVLDGAALVRRWGRIGDCRCWTRVLAREEKAKTTL